MAAVVVRQEWADGYRRLEAQRDDRRRYRTLHAQVDGITDQLRRRMGSVFTLDELEAEYRSSDGWVAETIAELPPENQWPPGVTLATDAAFHLYARGARDYEP